MRKDTQVLLARLGEEAFQYYSFESPSSDTDIWPMFEALLLDERVVGPRDDGKSPLPKQIQSSPDRAEADRTTDEIIAAPSGKPGLFRKYSPRPVLPTESVREMLGRLAISGR